MIIAINGTELIPGNLGEDCPGNGEHYDADGNLLECCCDDCDYLFCCMERNWEEICKACIFDECPRCIYN